MPRVNYQCGGIFSIVRTVPPKMRQLVFLVCHELLPSWERNAQMEDDDFPGYRVALLPIKLIRAVKKSDFPTGPETTISSKHSMQSSSSGLCFSLHYSSYPFRVSECIGKVRLHPLPNPEYLQRIFHHYFEFFVEPSISEMAPERAAVASQTQSPIQSTTVSPCRHAQTCFSRYSTKHHSSNMPSPQFVSNWVCALSMVISSAPTRSAFPSRFNIQVSICSTADLGS